MKYRIIAAIIVLYSFGAGLVLYLNRSSIIVKGGVPVFNGEPNVAGDWAMVIYGILFLVGMIAFAVYVCAYRARQKKLEEKWKREDKLHEK